MTRPTGALAAFLASTVLTAAALCSAGAASAAWSSQGSGSGGGGAVVMPAGAVPVAHARSTTVFVSWTASTLATGTAVQGYTIARFNADTGASGTVGTGCSGLITASSCVEQAVPAGSWVYTVTPVQLSWAGTPSSGSSPVTVP